jgi:succinate dehydrogenase / fumarate reductase flavoprotein subunit
MAVDVKDKEFKPINAEQAFNKTKAELDRILNSEGSEKVATLREEMQRVMMDKVGVFREESSMAEAVKKMKEIRQRYHNIKIDDKGKRFNTDLLEAWELGCLIDLALVTAESALARKESRGGHAREDFQDRDDENWLQHTMVYMNEKSEVTLKYKPVDIGKYKPMKRVY